MDIASETFVGSTGNPTRSSDEVSPTHGVFVDGKADGYAADERENTYVRYEFTALLLTNSAKSYDVRDAVHVSRKCGFYVVRKK